MRDWTTLGALALAVSLGGAVDSGDGAPYTPTAWPLETTTHDWQTTTTLEWETTTMDSWETTTTVDPSACPPGWINAVEGCFLFHYTEATTWASAQYECEKLGAFLAEPKTEEQVSLLVSLAFLEQAQVGVEDWWIGLTDQSHEGRWTWTHSVSDVSYTNWAPGFPSMTDVNEMDCAFMAARYGFSWVDINCSGLKLSPICEKKMPVTSTTTVPTTTTTTAMEESTTSYDPYHVELRGGYVGEDEAWGNVYAVNSQGVFGPVCDDDWGENEAVVVCKQLGYYDGQFLCGSEYGPVGNDFAMDDVYCHFSSGEWEGKHLQDCDYNLVDNCASYEGAGVICHNGYPTTTAYPGRPGSCDEVTTTRAPEQLDDENVDW